MNQPKLLKALLVIATALGFLTLPVWIFTSPLVGVGVPGLILTIFLLIAHTRALKSIRANIAVPQKNLTTQTIAGLLLIIVVACIIGFLSIEGDSTSQPTLSQVALNIAALAVPSFALYIGVLLSIKKYNKSTTLNTTTNIR